MNLWLLVALALSADPYYEALLGPVETVDGATLQASPGRVIGHAVRTRGRLERANGSGFTLAVGGSRLGLRLEPEAEAALLGRDWIGQEVEVEGLFYREPAGTGGPAHALRAWLLAPAGAAARTLTSDAPLVSLEELVYASGAKDGQRVRVRGVYRGANDYDDLPDATRRGRDWVLKDGYFAAWVDGHDPNVGAAAEVALEVVGVPQTANGIVRLAAQEVAASPDPAPPVVSRALSTGDVGFAAVPPRVSFSYPIAGEPLGPEGSVLVQFSKAMDPTRFEAGVRVRFERAGAAAGPAPRVRLSYRARPRALAITPEPAPPPGTQLVVDLLETLVDVDGRALAPATLRFGR